MAKQAILTQKPAILGVVAALLHPGATVI